MSVHPATPASALADAVARTRQSYDEAPYTSAPLRRAHPARMAANARFLGLAAPDASHARVLEIGCASGGHVIPLAAALPRAQFVGVDLSPVQIADGRARIARLGLTNIALAERSLADLGPADGSFDFIVCHGVYSWIPEPLRDDLLRVCKERLSPLGVAMISFNVLPGWRLFQMARDSMQLHAAIQADPPNRAAQTRELFALLARESQDKHSYGHFWRNDAARMTAGDDAYLAHELFEDSNAPCTFSDFAARAGAHGLAYLCESALAANHAQSLAPDAAATIETLAKGESAAREQYIDIFSGRGFREALLVHAERALLIDRAMDHADIEEFDLIGALALAARPAEGAPGRYLYSDTDEGVVIDDPAVIAPLNRLIARLPASSRLEDIAPAAATPAAERKAVAQALLRLVKFGHLSISTLPIVCAARLAERPKAWSLAVSDARQTAASASLRHAPVKLEPLQRLLLPLLDGAHARADLLKFALDLAVSGAMRIAGPDGPIEGRDKLEAALGPAIERALGGLLRQGVLLAE